MQDEAEPDDTTAEYRLAVALYRLQKVLMSAPDTWERDWVSLALRSIEPIVDNLVHENKLQPLPPVAEDEGKLVVGPRALEILTRRP